MRREEVESAKSRKRAPAQRVAGAARTARARPPAIGRPNHPENSLLDPDTIKLIEADDVALYVASSDAACRPHASRAFGCRASTAPYSLTTWVSRAAAAAVLEDIAENGRLAFTVAQIPSCRSLQLKAVNAEIVGVSSEDYPLVAGYQEGYVRATRRFGYPEAVMRSAIQIDFAGLAAIRFTPTAVFKQTPGLDAGVALSRAAEAFAK